MSLTEPIFRSGVNGSAESIQCQLGCLSPDSTFSPYLLSHHYFHNMRRRCFALLLQNQYLDVELRGVPGCALGCSGEFQGGRSQVSARSSSSRSSKQEQQRGAHSSCKSSICAVWESGSSLYFKYTRVFPICAELERAHERDFSGFSG